MFKWNVSSNLDVYIYFFFFFFFCLEFECLANWVFESPSIIRLHLWFTLATNWLDYDHSSWWTDYGLFVPKMTTIKGFQRVEKKIGISKQNSFQPFSFLAGNSICMLDRITLQTHTCYIINSVFTILANSRVIARAKLRTQIKSYNNHKMLYKLIHDLFYSFL